MSTRVLAWLLSGSALACTPAAGTAWLPAHPAAPAARAAVPVLHWDARFEWYTQGGNPLCAKHLAADEQGGFHAIAPFKGSVDLGSVTIESVEMRFLSWHVRADGTVDLAGLLPIDVTAVHAARASAGTLEILAETNLSATLLRYDAIGALTRAPDVTLPAPVAVTLLGQGAFVAHSTPVRASTRLSYFRDGANAWTRVLGAKSYGLAPAVSRDGRVAFLAALAGESEAHSATLHWARLADGVVEGPFPDPANTMVSAARFDREGRFWAFGYADFRLWVPPEQRDRRDPDAGDYAVAWALDRDSKLAAWIETDLRFSRVRELIDAADDGELYFVIGIADDADPAVGWLHSSFAPSVALEQGVHLVRARLNPPLVEVGRFPSALLEISSGSAGRFVVETQEARDPVAQTGSACRYGSFGFAEARR